MYLGQAMIDSRMRLDNVHDVQELQCLRESSHTMRESLIKEKKERKALEDYKNEYDPAMDTLRQEKQHLHEAVVSYIVEKNNFEKRIKFLEANLADRQQKLEDVEQCHRDMFDENDSRMRELEESVRKPTEEIEDLNAQLDKASTENEGTVIR